MLYYETKTVKVYKQKRENAKGTERKNINLTTKSKYEDGQKVVIIDAEQFKEYINQDTTEDKTQEIDELKKQLDDLEKENKKLRGKLEDVPDVVELQENHRREINKLNVQIREKDGLINSLIIAYFELFKRGFFARLLNTTPESYETIKRIKELPEPFNNNTRDN